tara:strand:+ start:157 stop:414 length:258 start_codon:yes stop_codon:yes gene_type:complete
MAAEKFVYWLSMKYKETKIIGDTGVNLGTLEPNTYFIIPSLYGGLIGQLLESGTNATVKWINHPEKRSNKKEIIAYSTHVFQYDY